MKHIVKKKLKPIQILCISLAVLIVLSGVAIAVSFIEPGTGDGGSETVIPEIMDGESLKYNQTIAYPEVDSNSIQFISIENSTGTFYFLRPETEEGSDEIKNFEIYYVDASGKTQMFYPEICEEDASFSYDSVYAVEMGDGFKMIPKLTYLCSALEVAYFDERITLSSDAEERKRELDVFCLSPEKAHYISFMYYDEQGKEQNHRVAIGDASLSGRGYYFMIDDRDYVYSTSSSYYAYALMGVADFVQPYIVAAGLSDDNGFGPYLVKNYYQWLGEMHETDGEEVTAGSRVIAYADLLTPALYSSEDATSDGYLSDGFALMEFNLSELAENSSYARLVKALIGKKVDKKGASSENFKVTVSAFMAASKLVDLSKSASVRYEYRVTEIEAILGDGEDITLHGTPLDGATLIKIKYDLYVDGEKVYDCPAHAVIDLSDEVFMADGFADTIRSLSVGELSETVSFTVDYTADNAVKKEIRYIVEEIISIYDQRGNKRTTIDENSVVAYKYYFEINGERSGDSITEVLNLKDVTDADADVKERLIGLKVGRNMSTSVREETQYYEYALDFVTYSIDRIERFVQEELISAFRFANPADRDPYYGESLYENLLPGKYSIYGLSSGVCEAVVKILGGISNDGSSGTASGLSGDKTLAIGLTPEVMKDYRLYANRIYFELPRQIYDYYIDGDADEKEQYDSYDSLGFMLYISDELSDGTRYIASDLYDLVTRVDGKQFEFLDYDFVSFWARRYMILMDYNYIENITVDFNMSDFYGTYAFELTTKSDETSIVTVKPSGECSDTKLIEYLNKQGYTDGVSLKELYDHYVGGGKAVNIGTESMGTTYFREVMLGIFYTQYQDVMSEEDREAAMKEENLLMTLTLGVTTTAYDYVYEFYRADDRRVLVRIYRQSGSGVMQGDAVDDFYISALAFKKIVRSFSHVLNAEEFDRDVAYPDEK